MPFQHSMSHPGCSFRLSKISNCPLQQRHGIVLSSCCKHRRSERACICLLLIGVFHRFTDWSYWKGEGCGTIHSDSKQGLYNTVTCIMPSDKLIFPAERSFIPTVKWKLEWQGRPFDSRVTWHESCLWQRIPLVDSRCYAYSVSSQPVIVSPVLSTFGWNEAIAVANNMSPGPNSYLCCQRENTDVVQCWSD